MKIFGVLLAVLHLALAAHGAPYSAESRRGRTRAQADLRAGKLVLSTWGLPPPWLTTYIHLLKKNYGVECQCAAFCTISPEEDAYYRAYDKVMRPEILRRYGQDVLERTEQEAQRLGPRRFVRQRLPYAVDKRLRWAEGGWGSSSPFLPPPSLELPRY